MSGKLRIGAVAVAIAAAVPAASVLGEVTGGGSGPGQTASSTSQRAAVHSVGAPRAATGPVSAKGHHGPRLAYFETGAKTVPPGKSSITVGPVPRRCHVINGYYFVRNKDHTNVASNGDSPAGLRKWAFYRDNESTPPTPARGVRYGVICIKGVGIIR